MACRGSHTTHSCTNAFNEITTYYSIKAVCAMCVWVLIGWSVEKFKPLSLIAHHSASISAWIYIQFQSTNKNCVTNSQLRASEHRRRRRRACVVAAGQLSHIDTWPHGRVANWPQTVHSAGAFSEINKLNKRYDLSSSRVAAHRFIHIMDFVYILLYMRYSRYGFAV